MPNNTDWSSVELLWKKLSNGTNPTGGEVGKSCTFDNHCATHFIIVGIIYFGFLFTLLFKVASKLAIPQRTQH